MLAAIGVAHASLRQIQVTARLVAAAVTLAWNTPAILLSDVCRSQPVLLSNDQLEINAPSYMRWGWRCVAGAKGVPRSYAEQLREQS
jgi:hypothetical protein